MGFALPGTKAFDPAAFAKGLVHSRAHQHSAWRGQLDTLADDHRYYVQKEFLQRYDPAAFELWFGLSAMLLPFPVLTVVLAIIEGKCFPQRYERNPMPWPSMQGGWSDDMRLAWHAIAAHPHMRLWWDAPTDVPALKDYLQEPALMIDMGLQLHYLDTLKDWMNTHA